MKSICPVSANPSVQTLLRRRWRNARTMRVIHARAQKTFRSRKHNTTPMGSSCRVYTTTQVWVARVPTYGSYDIVFERLYCPRNGGPRKEFGDPFAPIDAPLSRRGRSVKPETSSGNKPRVTRNALKTGNTRVRFDPLCVFGVVHDGCRNCATSGGGAVPGPKTCRPSGYRR